MIEFDRVTVERLGSVVLERLDLAVPAGRSVAIIGPAAAGKTSLLETIATLLPLRSGRLHVDGFSAAREPAAIRKRVGYLPDGIPAWPTIRVDECLELFAAADGLRAAAVTAAVGRSLAAVGLESLAGSRCDAVSADQGKRLLLARALLHDPPILLLDNPTAGLDPSGCDLVSRLLADAQLTGRTVIAALNAADVPAGFDDLVVLHEGRLVKTGGCRPEAHPEVAAWRLAIDCPAAAAAAARVIGHIAISTECPDDDRLCCRLAPNRGPIDETIAALVKAGIPVVGCRYDPPWPAQLLAATVADRS